jgi:hypothetical protein
MMAYSMKVGGHAILDSYPGQGTFTASGAVNLAGAEIGGSLFMRGAHLKREGAGAYALAAAGIKVGEHIILASGLSQGTFTSDGAIDLTGAEIGQDLYMGGAQLNHADEDGRALNAGQISVRDVYLDADSDQQSFTTAHTIALVDARLRGSLDLTAANLMPAAEKKAQVTRIALDAEGLQVGRKLIWRPIRLVRGQVNLERASAAELVDDWTGDRVNGCWPWDLRLDGFRYTTLSAASSASTEQRLDWIRGQFSRHSKGTKKVFGQPYEQLGRVYHNDGDDTAARKVAIAARRDQRQTSMKLYRKAANWVLDLSIAYGFRTSQALACLAVLYAAVLITALCALRGGAIVPVPQNSADVHPAPAARACTANYPCFNPYAYAFDAVVPLISLHETDYWRPDDQVRRGDICLWVSWAGTVLGWLLATLAVTGYTGLARRVDAP